MDVNFSWLDSGTKNTDLTAGKRSICRARLYDEVHDVSQLFRRNKHLGITMNSFNQFLVSLACTSALVLGLGACSNKHPDTSSNPAVASSSPAPRAASAKQASDIPVAAVTQSNALPPDWPSDIPVPTGLDLIHVLQSPTASNGKIAIYYGLADKAAVVSQITAALESAGYKQASATNHGPSISISTWTKGTMKVALNINTAAGKVTCSISTYPGN